MSHRPFTIDIPVRAIDDLRERLLATRWPKAMNANSWDDGASFAFMCRLVEHWANRFDWRQQEAKLNRLPHFMAKIGDADIHFVHQRGVGPSPLPLVLTHGWPGSFVEFESILPLLTDPAAHGGDPNDAFHVVVPSLPGYGFSPAPTTKGQGSRAIAGLWRELMLELGYEQFGAQGGDVGSGVSVWLARLFPDETLGIHLNYLSPSFRPHVGSRTVTPKEQSYLDRVAAWGAAEGAYAAMHATKPQTLSFSLIDSPVGLAAWITEKFRSWSDCAGDVESIVSLDTLLTDISIYWFGGDLAGSLRLYKENRLDPLVLEPNERIRPPLGMAHFPRELPTPPRSWVERAFDVTRWTEMTAGGHFAALEQPDALAREIRAFFRPFRDMPLPPGRPSDGRG